MTTNADADRAARIEAARKLIGLPRPNADVLVALTCAWDMGYRDSVSLAEMARKMLDRIERAGSMIKSQIWLDDGERALVIAALRAAPCFDNTADDRGAQALRVVRQMVEAYDSGNLQMSSPEIGEPENDIPYHPWHAELLHHARLALEPTALSRPHGGDGDERRLTDLEK